MPWLHPFLASMARSRWKQARRVEPLTQGSGVRPLLSDCGAVLHEGLRGAGAGTDYIA